MITHSQQTTISELVELFERLNAISLPSSDLMDQISSEINMAKAIKLKSIAAKQAEQSKAKAIMQNYVDLVVQPVITMFLPDASLSIYDDGTLNIAMGYTTFCIKSVISERVNEDKSKHYQHLGFNITTFGKDVMLTTTMSDFNDVLKKWVINTKKSNDGLY